MEVRVNGVYHPTIIQHLKEFEIVNYSFDLRPRSFNFTQGRIIKEMIESFQSPFNTFYLHFEDEKEFVISELLKDIQLVRGESSLLLEFSGKQPLDFCEQFETPYIWHFNESVNIDHLANLKYLRKISFDAIYLERLMQFGRLYDFLGQLSSTLNMEKISFEINAQWDSAIMETVLDFYNFSSLCYEINTKVEKSYRQIDLHLVSGHIEHTKRSLNI